MGYPQIKQGFTIRGSTIEQLLVNLKTGRRYELSAEQFCFLSACDGTKRLDELLCEYDVDSQEIAKEFLRGLVELGALWYSPQPIFRNLPTKLVPDIRLQAVHLEATSACNMRCAHCYQGDRYPISTNLSWEEILRLATEMHVLQVDNVSFSGGEPLINELTFKAARLFEDNDMRVSAFFTNGWQLDESTVTNLLSLQSNATTFVSLDSITADGMSFRGFSPEIGAVALRQILDNIKMLIDRELPVVINTVMTQHNIAHLPRMYELLSGLRLKSWRIGFPKHTGFFKENSARFSLDWDKMAECSFKILEKHLKLDQPFHLQIEYLFRPELFENPVSLTDQDFVCDYEGRREGCCIKPNGDVVSCAYCTDFPVGNIRISTLEEIWYSPRMQEIKNIRIGEVQGCKDCKLKPLCATGCRVNAHFLHGDFNNAKDDYACRAVQFFKDRVLPLVRSYGIVK